MWHTGDVEGHRMLTGKPQVEMRISGPFDKMSDFFDLMEKHMKYSQLEPQRCICGAEKLSLAYVCCCDCVSLADHPFLGSSLASNSSFSIN